MGNFDGNPIIARFRGRSETAAQETAASKPIPAALSIMFSDFGIYETGEDGDTMRTPELTYFSDGDLLRLWVAAPEIVKLPGMPVRMEGDKAIVESAEKYKDLYFIPRAEICLGSGQDVEVLATIDLSDDVLVEVDIADLTYLEITGGVKDLLTDMLVEYQGQHSDHNI